MKGNLRLFSGGRKLLSPLGGKTRPTTARVREAVMNILGRKVEGAHWLDLFSGSGIMGCEAIQRGAKRIVAVESNPNAAKVSKENLLSVAEDHHKGTDIEVVNLDVIRWLKGGFNNYNNKSKLYERFDLVYVDPPYGANLYFPTLEYLLKGDWIEKNSIVICEYSQNNSIGIPQEWIEVDRRIYGNNGLLILSPPLNRCDDTDSRQQPKGQKG